jgi:hypothetical protein
MLACVVGAISKQLLAYNYVLVQELLSLLRLVAIANANSLKKLNLVLFAEVALYSIKLAVTTINSFISFAAHCAVLQKA